MNHTVIRTTEILQGPVPAARLYTKQHSMEADTCKSTAAISHLILPSREGRLNITNRLSVVVCVCGSVYVWLTES